MATRKKPNIDIHVGEEVAAAAAEPSAAGQPVSQAASEIPDLTVRIFPIRNSKSKLRATASVNIGRAFAVQGFRVFDSQNGPFVKEPQQTYIKEGTEIQRSVFFPITKEARDKLYGQILHSYELVMEREQSDVPFVTDEDAPPAPGENDPDEDLPFDMTM